MYLDTRDEFHEAEAQEQALAGFNPLKAIGRALGSTGRAIVGAIVPGGNVVASALDTAARSGKGTPIPAALPPPPPSSAPIHAGAAVDRRQRRERGAAGGSSTTDAILARLATMTQPAAGGAGPVISVAAPAPVASAMPSWLLPAGIGLAALVLLTQGKRR